MPWESEHSIERLFNNLSVLSLDLVRGCIVGRDGCWKFSFLYSYLIQIGVSDYESDLILIF